MAETPNLPRSAAEAYDLLSLPVWIFSIDNLSVVRTFGTTRGVDQRSVGLVSD